MVSVVTPVYNAERYLARAIDSLLAQTHSDWELIAVDDGSTDRSAEILDRYRDPRIRTVRQENGGEAAARNRGLDLVSGDLVAFLDADDMYLPNALADLSSFLERHREYDMVFSNGYICDEHGTMLTELTDHRPGIHQGHVLESVVLHSSVITVPVCTMTRRAALERTSTRFDTSLGFGTDWDFWIRLARTSRFGYLDTVTCMYRVHLSNMTRLLGQRRWREDLAAGRMKVMNSEWFADLSQPTRQRFLQDFLITFLEGDGERQRVVLRGGPCKALPSRDQADLWRRVAIEHLVHGDRSDFVSGCLDEAVNACARDRKSRTLRAVIAAPGGRVAAPSMLRAWSRLQAGLGWLRHPRRPRPRAVPSALHPVAE